MGTSWSTLGHDWNLILKSVQSCFFRFHRNQVFFQNPFRVHNKNNQLQDLDLYYLELKWKNSFSNHIDGLAFFHNWTHVLKWTFACVHGWK